MRSFWVLNRKKFIIWSIYFSTLAIVYMQFMHPYLTSDSVPAGERVISFPSFTDTFFSGRFLTYIINTFYYVIQFFHISYYENKFVLQLLGMVLYACSMLIIYLMMEKYFVGRLSKGIVFGAIALSCVNPLMTETYTYCSFDFAVGIVLAVIAAEKLVNGKFGLGMIFCCLCFSVYQTNIFIVYILAAFCVFLGVVYNKDSVRTGIIKEFVVMCLCAGSGIACIVLQKILFILFCQGEPVKNVTVAQNIGETLSVIYRCMIAVLHEMYGMLPYNMWIVSFLVMSMVILIAIFANRETRRYSVMWCVLAVCMLAVPFSWGLVSSPYYPQRTMLSLFFSFGCMIIGSVYFVQNYDKMLKALGIISGVIMVVILFYTETSVWDCYQGQAQDIYEAMCIQSEIERYENETGIEIRIIVERADTQGAESNHLVQYFPKNYENYNWRKVAADWSRTSWLNYVNGENYAHRVMSDEEYQMYFGEQSWTTYMPYEQLHFEGNTLFWAIY